VNEQPNERPVISILTDFGLDGAVAACKGVILTLCREAQIIDVAHTIRKFAVRDGAWVMRAALPYLPVGAHIGVVDPGVGTPRHPIGLRAVRGDILIGPDNGLLVGPAEALGGIESARILENRDLWLPATTATFHGRDIFSPVAAHLAAGTAPFEAVGRELPVDQLVRLPEPSPSVVPGAVETEVVYVDSFGNVRLAATPDALRDAIGDPEGRDVALEFGGETPVREETRFGETFGVVPIGGSLLYVDSSGSLALADNQSNAAARLRVAPGQPVRITAA
jgi:S-adenosylmethionine hydrolase